MPEASGITREGRITLSPEERVTSYFAESAVRTLRTAARRYPDIKYLLQDRTFLPEELRKTPELVGSRWRYVFVRHSERYIDLEVKKTPIAAGGDLVEQVIRLRRMRDPLVRTVKLTREKGPERSENDEDAYKEINTFVEELSALF